MDLKTLKELLASLNINPDEIEDERYATAFRILFAIIEKQNEEIEFLKPENQKLRDEINLLKGEQTKPRYGAVAKTLLMGFTEINRNSGVYVMPVNSFKWKHYAGDIILLNVRWYLKYSLSYRNLEEMMAERGITVDHTTIMRWVHQYSPEIEKKVRRYLRPTNDSWRMDETYIKVKGEYKYLYRAVDSNGNTIDFMLSAKRNKEAAKRFLKKALGSKHNQIPGAITVDKNPAYPSAVNELKNDRILPQNVNLRQIKYLNNIVEQDHRSIKRIVRPMLGFQSFNTAIKTLKGIEIMHMIKKGQVDTLNRCVLAEVNFINKLFGIAA